MAGLYIHVPFCSKRCLYCDFFSGTELQYREAYVRALIREMELRHPYIEGAPVETIYFGGGTPSQLSPDDFRAVFDAVGRFFDLSVCEEITLEANPDDMTEAYVEALSGLPFNRISMGVQSFGDEDLRFLNRRHDAKQALVAVERCKKGGFSNISIDLIYGLPGQTPEGWIRNIETVLALDIPHISAYHLIYEEGTALYRLKEKGQVQPVSEETSLTLFSSLIERLADAGYLHYEISNFARPGFLSCHNSAYWSGRPYLGLGPSAHSYNCTARHWNIASLQGYLAGIVSGAPVVSGEELSADTRYNEYIITGLRTMWGVDLQEIERLFGKGKRIYAERQADPFLRYGTLLLKDGRLLLSKEGIFISDTVMSDLLWV